MYSQFRTLHLHLTIQIPQAILTKEGTSSLLEGAPFLYLHKVFSLYSYIQTQKKLISFTLMSFSLLSWRLPTLTPLLAIPSAQPGLTSLFGMGRGGTPAL